MNHYPYSESPDDDEAPIDKHSGSRLVLLLFLLPLTVVAGWVGWTVTHRIASFLLGYESAQRAGYVGSALAMGAMIVLILRWQQLLSPKAQSFSEDPIDTMSEDDEFDRDEDL
jgi:uncharacterized membrane protein